MDTFLKKILKVQTDSQNILLIGKKYIPALIDFFFYLCALINFTIKYIYQNQVIIKYFSKSSYISYSIFLIDFYVFSILYIFFLLILLLKKEFLLKIISLVITLVTVVLIDYTRGDLLTIKIFFFLSWICTIIISFNLKYSLSFLSIGSLTFVISQYHPAILGIVDNNTIYSEPDKSQIVAFCAFCVAFICIFYIYRLSIHNWAKNIAISKHLNLVMTQMSIFNQKLQDAAKNKGEEVIKQERMRITRDMHDSCGYAFVNIIALMDAAESKGQKNWQETETLYKTVRNLAAKSLQDTRKTLHTLREIKNPIEKTIDSLYEIKTLFHKITAIKINLDTGNLKKDYGRSINEVLTPIIQEALTNAVRHGRATEISIYLWDESNQLTLIVQDNGVGSMQIIKGIGLAGMEERLEKIGGSLKTTSAEEGGFRLKILIPLPYYEEINE